MKKKYEEKKDEWTGEKYTVEYFVLTDPSDSTNVVQGDGSAVLAAGVDEADGGIIAVDITQKEAKATVEEGAKIVALANVKVGAATSIEIEEGLLPMYVTSASNTATTNVNGTLTSEQGDVTVNAIAGMEVTLDKVVLTNNKATVTVGSKANLRGRNVIVNSQTVASVSGMDSVFIKGSNTSLVQVDDSASFTASSGVKLLAGNYTALWVGGWFIPSQGLKTNVIRYDATSKAEVKNLDAKDTSPVATWQADKVEVTASNSGSSDGLSISNYSVKKKSNDISDDTSTDEGNRNGIKVRDKVLNEDGTVTYTERDLGKTYIDSTGKQTEGNEAVPNPAEDPEEEEEEKEVEQGSTIGLNYAGSVIWQDLAYSTVANVENVKLNLVGSTKKVSVNAKDTASISAMAGAVAATREKIDTDLSPYRATLAGDVAVNDVTKNTTSTLKGVTINNASQVDNQALNMGSQVASALALGREVGERKQSTYANITATGSVNLINSKSTATITGSKINEQSAGGVVNNIAYDNDLQSAGGLSIDYARSYASTGASVSVNRAQNTITALIEKSTLGSSTKSLSALNNYAASNLTQTGSAISVGIIPTSQSEKTYSAVNGAVAVNTLTNTLNAKVKGSTVYTAQATIAAKDGKLAGTEEEEELNGTKKENPEIQKYTDMKAGNGTAVFDIQGKQVTSAVNSNNVEMVVNEKGEAQETKTGKVQYKASAAQVETAGNNITGSAINLVLNMQKEAVGNFTGGASVVYNKIKDDYQANVDSSTIVTAAGGSSDKPTFTVEALSNTSLVGLAAGIALKTSKATTFAAEAAGSVVNQNVTNTVKASVSGDSKITADYSAIFAQNNDVLFDVGGILQVAQVNLGLGMTWTQNRLHNVTGAYVDDATFAAATSGSGSEVSVLANNNTMAIAIAGALDVTATVGEKVITVAAQGAVARTLGTNDTEAIINKAKMEKAKKVAATAMDNSTTKEIAGTIAAGTGSSNVSLALGGAVATTSLGSKDKKQKVLAQINNSTLKTVADSALSVQALNNSTLRAIAAGGAVTAGTGLTQIGGQGSVVKTTLYSQTEASLTGNTVEKAEQNGGAAAVTVLSQGEGKIFATADGLSVAGGSGTLTIDAMGAVSVLESNADTIAYLKEGKYKVAGTKVTANSTQTITEVDAGVGLSLKGDLASVSVAGSVAINKINNNTEANLTNTTIEATELTSLASSVEKIHSYGGALSVGGADTFGASICGTVVLNTIDGATNATVSGSTIDTTGLLSVEAQSQHILDNVAITAGVAGSSATSIVVPEADGGKGLDIKIKAASIGVNATVALNTLKGSTSATVVNSDLNKKKTAGADKEQSVKVVANDKTTVKSYILTMPINASSGFTLSGAGSVDRNVFNRTTSATITGKSSTEQSTVNADSLTVDATSEATATIQENGIGIAASTAGVTAVGCVSVDNYANTTTAKIANITGTQENVSINAASTKDIKSYTSAVGVPAGKIAGSITASVVVVDDAAKTTATLESSTLRKATEREGSVVVKSTNTNKLTSRLGNVGLAIGIGGALGATVFVGAVNNTVASYVVKSKVGVANSNYNYASFAAEATNNLTQDYSSAQASAGLASIGAGVNVANYTSGALVDIAHSEIYAKNMNIAATENRTFEAEMREAKLAAVTLGANVNLINVGTALQGTYKDDADERATYNTKEIEDKVKAAKQQAKDATNTLASKDYAKEVVAQDKGAITFDRGGAAKGVVTKVEGSTLKATGNAKLAVSSVNNINSNIKEFAIGGIAVQVAVSNITTVNKNSVVVTNSSVSADTISVESKEGGTTSNLVHQLGFSGSTVNVQVTKVKRSGENTITFDKAQLLASSALTALAQDTTKITNEAKGATGSALIGTNVMVVRVEDKSNDLIYVQNGSTLTSYKETKAQEKLKIEAGEGTKAEGKERTTYIKDANGKTLRTIVSEYVTNPSDASKKIRQDKIYDEKGQDITSSEKSKLKTEGSDVYYCADYDKFVGGKVELTTENAVTASTTANVGVGSIGANPNVLVSTAQAGGNNTGRSEIIVTGENTFAGESVSLTSYNKQSVTASQKAVTASIAISVGVMNDKAINEGTAKVKLADNQTVIADKFNLTAQALAQKDSVNAEAYAWTVSAAVGITVGVNLTTATTAMDVAVDVGKETYKKYCEQATESNVIVDANKEKITGIEYTLNHTAPQQGGTAVAVNASSGTTVKSYVTSVTAGIISTGTNSAESKDENKVTVNIASGTNNAMGTLAINASNSDKAITYANGDGGGIISINPYAAKAKHTNNASTSVNLSGTYKLTGDFTVNVVNALTQEMMAKALQATVAGGSGILAENTVTNAALLNLNGATITTTGNVALGTENKVTFNDLDGYAVKGNNYGLGIIGVDILKIRNNITTTSTTNIGANTSITTEGGQSYWAKTDNTINSNLYLLGVGVKIVGSNVGSAYVDITANDKVELAKGAKLRTSQGTNDVILAAVDNQNIHTGTKAETTFGLVAVGASSAYSNNTLQRNNEVVVAGDILSYNDVKLLAGEDVNGALGNMHVKSEAEVFNIALLPVKNSPQVNNVFNQHNAVNVTGAVRAIHDATIYADAGKESTDTFCTIHTIWAGSGSSKYVSTTTGGKIGGKTAKNYFTVTGSVVAGLANKLYVTVGEKDGNNGYSQKIVVLDDTSYEHLKDDNKANAIILLSDEEYAKRKAAGTLKSGYPYRKYSEIIHVEDDKQKDIYDIIGLKVSDFQTAVVDYALGNYQRLEELRLLMSNYSETKSDGSNTAAYLGYQAEYNRIVKLLQDKKLIDGEGNLIGSLLVNSLVVPDLVSSGGNIYIQTPKENEASIKKAIDDGKLVAKGTPEIKLENYTSLATIVNDVTMKDTGGEIYHNGVRIYPATGSGGDAGNITITGYNKYASVKYLDDDKKEKTEPLMADIYIQGAVTNLKGAVVIESKNNDIVIAGDTTDASGNKIQGGSVSGKTVTLKADSGSISQGFVDTIINTRADPQLLYQSEYNEFVNAHKSSTKKEDDDIKKSNLKTYTPADKSKATGGYIAGGSVYISATDVNINGLVQSGFDYYYVDYDVDKTYVNSNGDIVTSSTSGAQTLSAKMQALEQKYAGVAVSDSNVLGNPNYMLTSGGSVYNATKGYYELEIATYYNPSTKKILVSNVDKTGGNIYITGRISSTGDGKLVCLDGTYDISVKVEDSKNHTVVTGQLLSNDTEGKITLKDIATNKTYVYTRENGTVYTTTYDLLEKEGVQIDWADETKEVFFTPQAGLRYNWTTGNNITEKKTYRKSWRNSWWGAGKMSKYQQKLLEFSKEEQQIGSQTTSTDVKRNGAYIGATQDSKVTSSDGFAIVWNYVQDKKKSFVKVTNQRDWSSGYLNCYKNKEVTWDVTTGSFNTYLASLKADNPVKIKFVGSESGASSIKVENTGTVELTGSVGNTKLYETGETSLLEKGTVTLTSSSGDVKQLGGGIYGEKVNLTAAGSIRDVTITAGDYVDVGAALSGESKVGDDTHIVSVLVEGNKGAKGDVSLTALGGASASKVEFNTTGTSGNITCADNVVITGRRIDLATQNGSITGTIKVGQTPLGSDTLTASLNAYAASDITLTQVAGDLRLGSITSSNGDVTLIVPEGSLADALPYDGYLTRDSESNLITSWLNAGLITSVAGDNEEDVAAAKAMVEEKNKLEKAAATEDGRTPNTYVAIDREALLYTIQDSVINPKSGKLPTTSKKKPNIQANNITLLVKDSVGLLGAEKSFTTNDIGTDTKEHLTNLKTLSQADASTVTWVKKDGVGSITIKEQLPIGIQTNSSSGKVTVGDYSDKMQRAGGNVFLQGRIPNVVGNNGDTTITNKDLTLGTIRADGNVNISSLSNIYNGAEDKTPAIVGASLTLTAAGSIGTIDKLLTTALFGGNTLQAVAKQGIYLDNIGDQTINVKSMSTGGDIDLRATGSILSYNSVGSSSTEPRGIIRTEQNGNITLTSREGSIGAAYEKVDSEGMPILTNWGLRIGNSEGLVTLKASDSIYVEGITTNGTSTQDPEGELNVAVHHVDSTGTIDAGELGKVAIYDNGTLNFTYLGDDEGFVATTLVSLDAKTGLSFAGSITAPTVKLRSKKGDLELKSGTLKGTTSVAMLFEEGNITEKYDNTKGTGANIITPDLTVKAGKAVDLGSKLNSLTNVQVYAQNSVTVASAGALGAIGTLTVGIYNSHSGVGQIQGDVTITTYGESASASKAIRLDQAIVGAGLTQINATGKITVTSDYGDIVAADVLVAGGDLSLSANEGAITVEKATTGGGKVSLRTQGGDITTGDKIYALTGDIYVYTGQGKILTKGDLTAEQSVLFDSEKGGAIEAQGALTAKQATVKAYTKEGSIKVQGVINAGTDVNLTTDKGDITTLNTVIATAGSITEGTQEGAITANATLSAGKNVTLTTDKEGGITTQGSVLATAGSIAGYTKEGNIVANAALSAGKDVTLTTAQKGAITTQYNIIATAGSITEYTQEGNIVAKGALSAGKNATLTTKQGNITTDGAVKATEAVTMDAENAITVNAAVTAKKVELKAINGDVKITEGTLTATKSASLYSYGGSVTTIYDNDLGTGAHIITPDLSVTAVKAADLGSELNILTKVKVDATNSITVGSTGATGGGMLTIGVGNSRSSENQIQGNVTITTYGDESTVQGIKLEGTALESGGKKQVNASGNIKVTSNYGNIWAVDVLAAGGDINLTSAEGAITLDSAATAGENVKLTTQVGNITTYGKVFALKGSIDAYTKEGSITTGDNLSAQINTSLTSLKGAIETKGEVSAKKAKVKAYTKDGVVYAHKAISAGTDIDLTSDKSAVTTKGAVTAADTVFMNAQGAIYVDADVTGKTVELKAQKGDIAVTSGTLTATKNMILLSKESNVTTFYNNTQGTGVAVMTPDLRVTAGKAVNLGSRLNSLTNVIAAANNAVTIGSRGATGGGMLTLDISTSNIDVEAIQGDVTITTYGDESTVQGIKLDRNAFAQSVPRRTGQINATGNITITSNYGNIWAADILVAGGDVTLSSQKGDITLDEAVTAGGTAKISTQGGAITTYGRIYALNDSIHAYTGEGDIYFHQAVSAENSIDLTTDKGDITTAGSVTAKTRNITEYTKDGNIVANGALSAGTAISLTTDKGSITTNDTVTAQSGDINLTSLKGAIETKGEVSAKKAKVKAYTKDGVVYAHKAISAGTDVDLTSDKGDVTAKGAVTAADTVFMNAQGAIYVDADVTGKTVELKAQKGDVAVTSGTLTASKNMILLSKEGNVTTFYNNTQGTGVAVMTPDLRVTAGKKVDLGSRLNSLTNVIAAANNAVTIGSRGATGGGMLTLDISTSNIDVEAIQGDVTITTYGDESTVQGIKLDRNAFAQSVPKRTGQINATGNITITSNYGNIWAADILVAGGDVSLSSQKGDITLDEAVTAGGTAKISTQGGAITTYGKIYALAGSIYAYTKDGSIYAGDNLSAEISTLLTSEKGAIETVGEVLTKQAEVKAYTKEGAIYAHKAIRAGSFVDLTTDKGDITTEDTVTAKTGSITETTQEGKILAEGKLLSSTYLKLTTGKGSITTQATVTAQAGSITEYTKEGTIIATGALSASEDVSLATEQGNLRTMATVTAQAGSITEDTKEGNIVAAKALSAGEDIILTTGYGDITLSGEVLALAGDIYAYTKDGNIVASGALSAGTAISLTTDKGSITTNDTVTAQGGDITAISGGGNILTVGSQVASKNVKLITAGGNITTLGSITATAGDITATTQDGAIVVNAALNAGTSIYLYTDKGDITTNGTLTAAEKAVATAEGSVTVNNSITAQDVHLEAQTGDINLNQGTVTGNSAAKLIATSGKIKEIYANEASAGAAIVTADLYAKAAEVVDLGSKLNGLQLVHVDAGKDVTIGTNGAQHMAIGITNSRESSGTLYGNVSVHSYGDLTQPRSIMFLSNTKDLTLSPSSIKTTGDISAVNDSGDIYACDALLADGKITLTTAKGNIAQSATLEAGKEITIKANSSGDNTLYKNVQVEEVRPLDKVYSKLRTDLLGSYADIAIYYAYGNIVNAPRPSLVVGSVLSGKDTSLLAQHGIVNMGDIYVDKGDISLLAGSKSNASNDASGHANIVNGGGMVVISEGDITVSTEGKIDIINNGNIATREGDINLSTQSGNIVNSSGEEVHLILTAQGNISYTSTKGNIDNYGNSFALGRLEEDKGNITMIAQEGNVHNETDLGFTPFEWALSDIKVKEIVQYANGAYRQQQIAGGDITMLAQKGYLYNAHDLRSHKGSVTMVAQKGLTSIGYNIFAEKDITLTSLTEDIYNSSLIVSTKGDVSITAEAGGIINTRTQREAEKGNVNGGNIVALDGKVILEAKGSSGKAELKEHILSARSGSVLNAGDIVSLGKRGEIRLSSQQGDVVNSDDFTNMSDKNDKSLGNIYKASATTRSVKEKDEFTIATTNITLEASEGKVYTSKDLYAMQGSISITAKEGLSNYAYKLFANKDITLRATAGDVLNTSEIESSSGNITLTADKGSVLNLQGADIVTLGGDVTLTSGANADGTLYYIDINDTTGRQEVKSIADVASYDVHRYYRTSPTGEWIEISSITPTPEQTEGVEVKTIISYSLNSAPQSVLTKELGFDSTAYRNGSVINYGDIIASNENAASAKTSGSIKLISERSNVDNFDDFNKYSTSKSEVYTAKKAYATSEAGKSYNIATGNIELRAPKGHIYNAKKLLVADNDVTLEAYQGMESFGEKIYAGGNITLHATNGLLANNAELVSVEGDITLYSDNGAVVNMLNGDLVALKGAVTLYADLEDPTAAQTLRYVDVAGHKGIVRLNGAVPAKNLVFIVDKYYIPAGSTEYKRIDASVDINKLTGQEQNTIHSVFSYVDDEGEPHYTYDASQISFTDEAGHQLAQETISFTDKLGDKIEKAVALKSYVEAYREGDVVNSGDIGSLNVGSEETGNSRITLRSELSNTTNYDNYLVIDGKYDAQGNGIYDYDGTAYFNTNDPYHTSVPGIQIGVGAVDHLAESGYLLSTEDIVSGETYAGISNDNLIMGRTSGNVAAAEDVYLQSYEGRVKVGVNLTAGENLQINAVRGITIDSGRAEQVAAIAYDGQVKLVTQQGDVVSYGTVEAHATSEDEDLINGSINVSSVYGSVNMAELLADKSASIGVSGEGAERATITLGTIRGKQVVLMNDDVRTGEEANIQVGRLTVGDSIVLRGETMDLCPIERSGSLNETLSIIAVGAKNGTIKGTVDFTVPGNTRFNALNVTDTNVDITNGGKLKIDRMNISGSGYFHSQGFNTSAYGKGNPVNDRSQAIYFDQGIYQRSGKTITAVDPKSLFYDSSSGYVPFKEMSQVLDAQHKANETFNQGDNTWMNLYVDSTNRQRSNGLLLHMSDQYYGENQRYSMEDSASYLLNNKAHTILTTQYTMPVVEFARFNLWEKPQQLWGEMAEVPATLDSKSLIVEN